MASRRLGDDVALHVVDLSDRLPFSDDAFDDVVASLVPHHLPSWPIRSRGLGPTTSMTFRPKPASCSSSSRYHRRLPTRTTRFCTADHCRRQNLASRGK
ncbi:hypothetical protein [Streptomyces mirabilis]